jgi:hypothetical protein
MEPITFFLILLAVMVGTIAIMAGGYIAYKYFKRRNKL